MEFEDLAEELDIINSAKQVVIKKAIYEVLNEVLEIVYSQNDSVSKATPRIKNLLAGIKDKYEGVLYAEYITPEDVRLEAIAKIKTVNKILRMI